MSPTETHKDPVGLSLTQKESEKAKDPLLYFVGDPSLFALLRVTEGRTLTSF